MITLLITVKLTDNITDNSDNGRAVNGEAEKDYEIRLQENKIKNKIFQDPTATDGGAYKCAASNELGESNANINLNFAGADEEKSVVKGPTFVGKPKIIPQQGGSVIVLECRVRSTSGRPTAVWTKNDQPVREGPRLRVIFADESENVYLCQCEIKVIKA